ncbi:MAG: hypothetical protein R2909_22690 [Gemmatimonadales bacterium]
MAAVARPSAAQLYAALYRVEAGRIACLVEPRVVAPGEALGGPIPDRLVGRISEQALVEWPWAAGATYVSEAAGRSAEHLLDLREVPGGTRMVDDLAGWEPGMGGGRPKPKRGGSETMAGPGRSRPVDVADAAALARAERECFLIRGAGG